MPNPGAPECACGNLERLSREPSYPITFDGALNEYHLVGSDGGQVMIYHCLFCGGRTSPSRRESLFAHITQEEIRRLEQVYAKLKKLPDVLSAWGNPDQDSPTGYSRTPKTEDGSGATRTYRMLTYRSLSPLADVQVIVDVDGDLHFSLMPKAIGEASR